MNNSFFLYDDNLSTEIKKLKFDTNILEQYDNVVYHANLFTYPADVQQSIDKGLASNGIYEPYYNKRIYICRDGVTTKFSISSFIMKNVFGNINSPLNIGTYEIKIKLQETFSCMLTNELEVLAYKSGYQGYMFLPYWFEIYFSGYKHDTLEPVSKIPLPNGETSLIFEGNFGNVVSHLESSGTTWDISFVPNYMSLVNKNTNILSVASSIKSDKKLSLKEFLSVCADNMFDRMIYQYANDDNEKNHILGVYNKNKFMNIIIKEDKSSESITNKNDTSVTLTQSQEQEQEQGNSSSSSKDLNNISQSGDRSENSAKLNSTTYNTDKTTYFTTICQDFLCSSDKYKSYVAKYDIKSTLLEHYKHKPLCAHTITITLEKDPYMEYILNKESKKTNTTFDRAAYFRKCVNEKSLIKRYQFGYSGMDTSVLEATNKYDNLYYMNALPSTVREHVKNNIFKRDQKINDLSNKNNQETSQEANTETKQKGDEAKQQKFLSSFNQAYNLEDIYSTLSEGLSDTNYFKICYLNNVPKLNNDSTNDNRRNTTNSDIETEKEEVASKILWERLFKSGQMSETKFTILGDPYWIATQAFKTSNESNNSLADYMYKDGFYTPNYRCIFTIKSTPDQNQAYTIDNPTDYDFEYSMHASGIYMMIDCESIFEDGKFTQKLHGAIDVRFIREIDE